MKLSHRLPGLLHGLANGLTEGLDFLDCMHDALPKASQAKKKRYKDSKTGKWKTAKEVGWKRKAEAVRLHLQQVDPTSLIQCHIKNQVTDRIGGELSSRAAKAYGKATGRPIGIGVGPAL